MTQLFSSFLLKGSSAFVLTLALVNGAHANTLTGVVVGLADGDTLTVLDAAHQQVKVRLSGIDAPEKSQAFGTQSKQALAELAFQKTVQVSWQKQDRYGRVIGVVYVLNQDVGLELVRQGLAWHYKQYQREQRPEERTSYAIAEQKAQAAGLGLWKDKAPMPPWEFRHQKKLR